MNKTSTQTALFETFLLGRPQIVAGTVQYSVCLAKPSGDHRSIVWQKPHNCMAKATQQHGKSHTMP